jgi:hypothetical protein
LPLKIGKKKYKSFSTAASSIAKSKGISKERASAYVATIARAKGDLPPAKKKKKK